MTETNLGAAVAEIKLALSSFKSDIALVKSSLRGVDADLKKTEKGAKDTGKGIGDSFKQIAFAAKAQIAGIVADSFRVAFDAMKKFAYDANDLGDAISKNSAVFAKSADAVLKWSETTTEAMGIAQRDALDTAGTLGQLYQNIGITEKASAQMSTSLIQLAVDMAAINNIPTDQALDRIKRGARGSAEALDELGISITAAMIEDEALRLGLIKTDKEALTPATKAQAQYSLMMQQGAKYAGQFAKESGTLSAQTKILEAEFKDVSAAIGKELVPVALDIVRAFRDDLLPALKEFGIWAGGIIKDMPVVVSELGKIADPMGVVAGVTQRAANSFKALGEAFTLWMHSVAQDANSLGKIQKFMQDASDLETAAKRVAGNGPVTSLTSSEINAANRYGAGLPPPAIGTGNMNPDTVRAALLNAAKKARQESENALASAKVVRQMEAAQGKGNDMYYGRGQTPSTGLGAPALTPQAPGGGGGRTKKGRKGASTHTAPGLDSVFTPFNFLPFGGDFIEQGRQSYLDALDAIKARMEAIRKAAGNISPGNVLSQFGTAFSETAKKQKDEQKQIDANKLAYSIETGKISLKEAIFILDMKLSVEKEFTDEWMKLAEQRRAFQQAIDREEAANWDKKRSIIIRTAEEIVQAQQDAERQRNDQTKANRQTQSAEQLAEIQRQTEAVKQSAGILQGAFSSLFSTGKMENFFSSLVNGFKQAIAQIVAQMAAAKVVSQLFGVGAATAAGLGGPLALFGSIFGGFRAAGGPVSPGRSYVVGERGPEIFRPRGAGDIIPNGGGMGAMNVNFYGVTLSNGYDTERLTEDIAFHTRQRQRVTRGSK